MLSVMPHSAPPTYYVPIGTTYWGVVSITFSKGGILEVADSLTRAINRCKNYTPSQVAVIYEYLGEPLDNPK